MPTAEERRAELKAVYREASGCERCPQLVAARQAVVFGAGHADADLMVVAGAPGRQEDEQGLPLVGAAGRLLTELLEEAGLSRTDVYVTTAVKSRTPGGREPLPGEVLNCRGWLERQVELVRPLVVCALGGLATRVLRGDPAPVTRVHGKAEVRVVGGRAVRVLPLFHPSAALYREELLRTLRADIAKLPALLALEVPEQPSEEPAPVAEPEPPAPPSGDDEQLGLF